MDVFVAGAVVRAFQGMLSAIPTFIVGLFITAILRFYLRSDGTLRLFGGSGFRSLAQSWLVGMLLPVCSIGVIPIIRELKRVGLRPGAISAFALSAPLFNPLSLLYGLTLSRPYVIVGFALGSLLVVTILGMAWDRYSGWIPGRVQPDSTPVSLRRLGFVLLFMARELMGPSGRLALVAVLGLILLAILLPHGSLQSSVEQDNNWAPLTMMMVSIPVYATPMLTMSQLGMMFVHGNSPGAAFCLLLLGTGVNLGTLLWMIQNYGWRSTATWFAILLVVVMGCAYGVNKPLIPPGVEPAGHTHAFDIYTSPFSMGDAVGMSRIQAEIGKVVPALQLAFSLAMLTSLLAVGVASRTVFRKSADDFLNFVPDLSSMRWEGMHRRVSTQILGGVLLSGLVALSIVGCYAYYPSPEETLEEMSIARVNVLSAVSSRDYEQALHHIPELEHWSRLLEVGYFIRNGELRPYQRMQAHLLRKKLELLEHACEDLLSLEDSRLQTEGDPLSPEVLLEQIDALRYEISQNSRRLSNAFRSSGPSK